VAGAAAPALCCWAGKGTRHKATKAMYLWQHVATQGGAITSLGKAEVKQRLRGTQIDLRKGGQVAGTWGREKQTYAPDLGAEAESARPIGRLWTLSSLCACLLQGRGKCSNFGCARQCTNNRESCRIIRRAAFGHGVLYLARNRKKQRHHRERQRRLPSRSQALLAVVTHCYLLLCSNCFPT
jgi:hypothetical protein